MHKHPARVHINGGSHGGYASAKPKADRAGFGHSCGTNGCNCVHYRQSRCARAHTGGAGAVPKSLNGFEFWQPWPIDQPTHGGPIGWKQLSEAFNATTTNKVHVSTPAGDYIAPSKRRFQREHRQMDGKPTSNGWWSTLQKVRLHLSMT